MLVHAVRVRRTTIRSALLVAAVSALTATLATACTSGGSSAAQSSSPSGRPSTGAASTAPSTSTAPSATPAGSTSTQVTPVPAPSPGNISQTVPSRAVSTRPAVPVGSAASFGDKVTVRATTIRAITAKAKGPGEIGGPAVAITLRFTNNTSTSIDLGNTVVTVLDSAKDPASTIAGSPADPVTGRLAAGRSASGTYVFTVPTNRRTPITINISYAPSAPVVLLVGNVG